MLADNLGRLNYGSNTGERKGLLDTLYLGGRQIDPTAGWVALWQEAVFAGEALAGARAAFVRPDAAENVSPGNLAFQGPSLWLLRDVEARRAALPAPDHRRPQPRRAVRERRGGATLQPAPRRRLHQGRHQRAAAPRRERPVAQHPELRRRGLAGHAA
ncbi:MAG: hypothetical protein IPO81_18665 [Kouleothrix sp.]|nr:hypothetical protein [Kouleothrix sp.]